jgi:hypothetical protein
MSTLQTGAFEFAVSHPEKPKAKSPPRRRRRPTERKRRRSAMRYWLIFERTIFRWEGHHFVHFLKIEFMLNNSSPSIRSKFAGFSWGHVSALMARYGIVRFQPWITRDVKARVSRRACPCIRRTGGGGGRWRRRRRSRDGIVE